MISLIDRLENSAYSFRLLCVAQRQCGNHRRTSREVVMGGADRMVTGGMETKALRHFLAFAAFFFCAARLCFLPEPLTGTDWLTAAWSCSVTQAFRLLPKTAAVVFT